MTRNNLRDWNPRYVNYARAHGRTPEGMLAFDKQRLPGACMMEFIFWNRARIVDFSKAHPECFIAGGLKDHEAYDEWLTGWVDQSLVQAGAA